MLIGINNIIKEKEINQKIFKEKESSFTLKEKEEEQSIYYTSKDLEIKSAPSEISENLDVIKKGKSVIICNIIKNWIEVKYNEKLGYIKIDFLLEEKEKDIINKTIEEKSINEELTSEENLTEESIFEEKVFEEDIIEETFNEENYQIKETYIEKEANAKEENCNIEDETNYIIPEVTAAEMQKLGIVSWGGYRFTWYSEKALPGYDLPIPGRYVDENGYVCDENDYICLASDSLPKGMVVATPLGKEGKIYDCGTGCDDILDIYVSW